MIPVFSTGGILIAPGAALLSSGYVAGNTLAAQHLNWYLFHLTKELNNLLTAAGLSQNAADDTQITQAVRGLTPVLTSTNNTVSAIAINTLYVVQTGSATVQTFTAGAAAPGILLGVYNQGSGSCTVVLSSGVTTLILGSAQLVIVMWNGQTWEKVGGNTFTQVFTSGSGVTWKCPFTGSYKATVVGGGGGGGGVNTGNTEASGGGGGGASISSLFEMAGATFTYTVGAGGSAGAAGGGIGGTGGSSTLGDGTVTLTGAGGVGGNFAAAGASTSTGGAGGLGSGGQVNTKGSPGGQGLQTTAVGFGGNGGSSILGGGAAGPAVNSAGGAGQANTGGGGSGAFCNGAGTPAGGVGGSGLVVIEF